MTEEEYFKVVCSKIEEEKTFLNQVSQEIWGHPELGLKEVRAHDTLVRALKKCGFQTQENYLLPTAFRAEHCSGVGGPSVAVLLEYDALPDIGHACGHNLIAEAGLAAALAIRAAMEHDRTLKGKLVVLGTPAEESTGGKILLMEKGALEGMDAAMMVHPTKFTATFPPVLSRLSMIADFKGKEAHAAAFPWEGRNALDAAVSAYQNIAMLRQQMKPTCRIHTIITKGGSAANIIPADARLELYVRAPSRRELDALVQRTKQCVESGAAAAACSVTVQHNDGNYYANLVSNKVMGDVYRKWAERLGLPDTENAQDLPVGSTDMGNVSHFVPSIHPFYEIRTQAVNHTREFTEAAGAQAAQGNTLAAAKAMAMTAIALMRTPQTMEEAKKKFREDMEAGL